MQKAELDELMQEVSVIPKYQPVLIYEEAWTAMDTWVKASPLTRDGALVTLFARGELIATGRQLTDQENDTLSDLARALEAARTCPDERLGAFTTAGSCVTRAWGRPVVVERVVNDFVLLAVAPQGETLARLHQHIRSELPALQLVVATGLKQAHLKAYDAPCACVMTDEEIDALFND